MLGGARLVVFQSADRRVGQPGGGGEFVHRPAEQGAPGPQVPALDEAFQAVAQRAGRASRQVERGDVVHPSLDAAAGAAHRHHDHAVGDDLAARQQEARLGVDDLLREIEFPSVVAPARALLLEDRQGRLFEEGLLRLADQFQPFGREVGVGVDPRHGGEGAGLFEDLPLAPLLRRLRPRQDLAVAHVDQHAHGLDRAPIRCRDDLAAAHHGAQRPVRAEDAKGLLGHPARLQQVRGRGDAGAILRVNEREQEVVRSPGRTGLEAEDAEEARRPDVLVRGEGPRPRPGQPEAFHHPEDVVRQGRTCGLEHRRHVLIDIGRICVRSRFRCPSVARWRESDFCSPGTILATPETNHAASSRQVRLPSRSGMSAAARAGDDLAHGRLA